MATTWTREWLKRQGYTDEDIGWDPTTQSITLKGRPLLKAESVSEGRSYASPAALQSALTSYTQRYPTTTTTYSTREKELADALASLSRQIKQPFSYDVESDPRYRELYQAAKRQSEANVKSLGRTAMEQLNARGILDSTITADRLAQIAADESARLGATTASIIPELYQAALQERQAQTANLSSLAQMLASLQSAARSEEAQQTEAERAAQQWAQQFGLSQQQLGLQQQQWAASPEAQSWYLPLYRQRLLADIAATGRSGAGGGTSYSPSQRVDDLMRVWQLTGTAPAGLESLGVQAGTRLGGEEDSVVTDARGFINDISAGTITKQEAITTINRYKSAGVIPVEHANALIKAINAAFPEPKATTKTKKQTTYKTYPAGMRPLARGVL